MTSAQKAELDRSLMLATLASAVSDHLVLEHGLPLDQAKQLVSQPPHNVMIRMALEEGRTQAGPLAAAISLSIDNG